MDRKEFLKLIGTASVGTPFMLNGFKTQAMNQFFDFPISCDKINDRVLVIVRLGGANDGLNTVIPVSQYSSYATMRPNIKINETGPNSYIRLDETQEDNKNLGLHPNMMGFKSLYDNGKLSLINGVGYPSPNYSHFASEVRMFSGKDGTSTANDARDGMFGRYLAAVFPGLAGRPSDERQDPLGIQLGNTGPSLFFGHSHENSIEYNVSGFQTNLFNQLSKTNTSARASFSKSSFIMPTKSEHKDLLDYITGVQSSMDVYYNRIMATFNAGSNSATSYPSTDLANQLKTVARLIRGGCKTKIYQVNLFGFDTHATQTESGSSHLGTHATLLKTLCDAINAFHTDLSVLGIENRVMTTTFSEFGRQLRENGSRGTDHGDLSPFFVVGSGVNPGILGDHPIFSNTTSFYYNQNQRKYDYRQIFTTLMQDWLGANNYMLEKTELTGFSKIPIISNHYNATKNGCLTGIFNSDTKAVFSTQSNGIERINNNIPSGDLVIESKNKGFVITRLTTEQRDATTFIPTEGMLIYNLTENCYQIYNGSFWKCIEKT